MNKKYVVVSILIGCIVGSIFVYFFRRTEDNRASDVHYKTVLHNTAQPAEKTAPVQEDDAEKTQGKIQEIDVNQPLYEVDIQSINVNGNKTQITGQARVPIEPLKTEKQRQKFAKGKLTIFGHTWIVRKEKKKLSMPTYYLYRDRDSEIYTYVMQEDTPWLNYPSYFFSDKDGNRLYEEVGVVSIQIDELAFEDSGGAEGYKNFVYGTEWSGKWIPIEIENGRAVAIDPNGIAK